MAMLKFNLVRTSKPISLIPLLALITMFLMVNSEDSFHFNFDKFTADEKNLILQGDATTGEDVLQLTKLEGSSVGRALYTSLVHLFDSSKLDLGFSTTFTFKISSSVGHTPGDGLAFFLASPDTTIPPNSYGKYLGLFPGPCANETSDKVVAVEFDTYPNLDIGDPEYIHIGLDFNNITSAKTTPWDWQDGETATVFIEYDSAIETLSVSTQYPGTEKLLFNYPIDLSKILPEWVRVGFSASTGAAVQSNTILSWSFTLITGKKKKDIQLASIV